MTRFRTVAGICLSAALGAGSIAYGQFHQQAGQQPGQQAGQAEEQMVIGQAQVRERQGPVIELEDQQQATITAMFRQEHDAPEIIVMESSADQSAQSREIVFSPQQAQKRVVTYEGQPQGGQERSLIVTARRQDQDVEIEQISQQEGIIVLGIRRQQEDAQQAGQVGGQTGQDEAGQQEQAQQGQQAEGQEGQQQAGMDQPGQQADQAQQQAGMQAEQQQTDQAQMAADQEQPTPDQYDAVLVIFLTGQQ